MSLQVELLEEIFNDIKPYGNLFVSSFYENLFKAYPETKSLFTDTDLEIPKKQLWDDLVLVFDNLRQPDTLKNVLQGLGARLYTYGALTEHYPQAKDAFSITFTQFLGSEWTTEFEQAWNEAYLSIRELMLDGAEQTRIQMAHTHPVLESEEILEKETEITEEVIENLVSESEEILEEEIVINANTDDSLEEVKLNAIVSESTDMKEETALTVEELLEESFNDIKPYGSLFVNTCYENLFKAHPEIKPLFTAPDPETKKTQLWDDLVLVIDNLDQPETLNNILQGLGAKLFTYGALPEHYPLLKDALFTSFEQFLGSEWTNDFKKAWLNAYVTFGGMILKGAAQAQQQIAHKTHISESTATLEEEVAVAETDSSLAEEILETPVTESAATLEEEVIVAETDSSLAEEILETPVTESAATLEEEVTVAETDSSLGEEILETPPAESINIVEEEVIIEDSTDNFPEKTTMPEPENNTPQEDIILEQSQDSLEEIALADLSENLKSKNIDPQFTQIFSPESQPESTATAVKPVAGEKTYETENKSRKSNNKLLVGGGFAGIAGIIWLLIILL